VLAERITAKISDKLIVVSNENISYGLANRIGRKEQYMVIRSGIKTGKYRQKFDAVKIKKELGLKETDKIITTIGPFKPQKNTVDFIDMAAQVSGKFPDVKFLVIGDGALRPQIESKIAAFNLQDKVMLLGWRNDIPELLSITDIFILTSLWEGLPRAIVESMVSGKPVIAYAVDGSKEIVKDNVTGFLIPPKNMKVLCEKTMLLLSDNNLRLKFGMEAQKTVSTEFDIDRMVKQQESLYKDLVKK
jgi:glycosyltransferase involved in cell wall biosynthesis